MQFGSVSENAGLPNSYYIPKNGYINPVGGEGKKEKTILLVNKLKNLHFSKSDKKLSCPTYLAFVRIERI